MSGLELLSHLRERVPDLPVIIMTAHSDLDSAVSAYQGGGIRISAQTVRRGRSRGVDPPGLPDAPPAPEPPEQVEQLPEIIGEAPSMQEVFRAIGRLSRSNITVLITGESGSGKELVARALHRHSPRADKSFIAINTAAIPRDLLESELFGHERGAFTGAQTSRQGRFEQANSGTLFLDEIGDMPAELQTRLLRVLAEASLPGGRSHPDPGGRAVIAATHQNLEQRVRRLFREDLYHRLNVIRIQLPSLNKRREDIPLLTRHFLSQAARELGVESKVLRPETEVYLSKLDWPGNVRQLENLCRWLTVMASGREIHLEDLPMDLRERGPAAAAAPMGGSVAFVGQSESGAR